MLKSCKYCGKIHDSKYICKERPNRKKEVTDADRFRWTGLWREKREEIKKRDLHLCQICIRELYNTVTKYNTNELSVHHNIPINEDYNKRLDNDNLITVCSYHHEMCENKKIPRDIVQKIINEQEMDTPLSSKTEKWKKFLHLPPTFTLKKFPHQHKSIIQGDEQYANTTKTI